MKPRTSALVVAFGVVLASAAIAAVAGTGIAAPQAPPSNQSPPTISGAAEVGKTLTASAGTWAGTAPITYAYQWRRCDADGSGCADIGAATARTYVLKRVDAGNTIRVRVTASNSEGSASASSVPTAVVKAAPSPSSCAGSAPLQVARIAAPERLTIDGQQISPPVAGRSTTTVTVRFHVSCDGKPVQGALVYVTAVCY